MAVKLRLARGGSKKRPHYSIVAADVRAPRDGKYLEKLGTYNPLISSEDAKRVNLNEERLKYWIGVGATPTDRVARFLNNIGLYEWKASVNLKKGEPGEKAKARTEEKKEKIAAAAEEAKAKAEEAKEAAKAAKEAEKAAKEAPAEAAPAEAAPAEAAPAAEAAPEASAEAAPAEDKKDS